jgi:hypothetical protein
MDKSKFKDGQFHYSYTGGKKLSLSDKLLSLSVMWLLLSVNLLYLSVNWFSMAAESVSLWPSGEGC